MIYGSVCSGIEAATVAWHPLGWKPAWFSEFDKFPSLVLKHHYPDVPNLGDMTKLREKAEYNERTIDILVGGTPCQSFSIAGLRKGLDDERGNLALKFCEILRDKQPRWFVWENVPGVLSSNRGRDFASILSGFRECGYGIAYRILDAQYFGVAQRRRRVFVIGHFGDWRAAGAVLFERESVRGYPAPRRETGQRPAPTFDVRAGRSGENSFNTSGGLIAGTIDAASGQSRGAGTNPGMEQQTYVAFPINTQVATRHNKLGERTAFGIGADGDPSFTLGANHHHAIAIQERAVCENPDAGPGGVGVRDDGLAYTLEARQTPQAVTFQQNQLGELREGPVTGTLNTNFNPSGRNTPLARTAMPVRRLTPRECERLQGFPDDYTKITDKTADGPRYKALGNSMAVPCMAWIGKRIQMVEDLKNA